jgi:site-specific recombinase XerD
VVECLPSKQVVTGSNPASRSTTPRPATCLPLMSLEVQLARYHLDAGAQGFSEVAIIHTERCVRSFAAFSGGIGDVAAVEANDLRRFILYLKDKTARHNCRHGKTLSPVSVNTYIRAVRSFWSWLEKTQAIASNPFARVPAPRYPRKVARVYSEEQLKILLRYVNSKQREHAIIDLLLDSGIRLSELTGLTVDDFDLVHGSVKVLGKGGKERFSYFSPVTALSLRDYLDKGRPQPQEDDFFFLTNTGFRLDKRGVQSSLSRLGRAAGLSTRLSPHMLRHTYATLCLKNGNNLEYVRITLGHTNIKTTSDAYLAASQADVATAHHRFSPLANLNRGKRGSPRLL